MALPWIWPNKGPILGDHRIDFGGIDSYGCSGLQRSSFSSRARRFPDVLSVKECGYPHPQAEQGSLFQHYQSQYHDCLYTISKYLN